MRFRFEDVDDYVQWAIDMAGPLALVLRGLPDEERRTIAAQLEEAFTPYAAGGGYELPGVALCALAR